MPIGSSGALGSRRSPACLPSPSRDVDAVCAFPDALGDAGERADDDLADAVALEPRKDRVG